MKEDNPFGGGTTGTGEPRPKVHPHPAHQFGGDGKVALITLQQFWAGNDELVVSPLKIQYATNTGKVISRDNVKNEYPAGDLTIHEAAKQWDVNTADPSVDSPPLEIRANYTTNAPKSFVAEQVNVGDLLGQYHGAFGPTGNTAMQTAWLVNFFGMPETAAAAYLGKK